jgi:hypothetical protein
MKSILSVMLFIPLFLFCTPKLLAKPYMTQGDVPAEGGFRNVTVVEGLEHPWGMTWLPGLKALPRNHKFPPALNFIECQ